MTLVRSAELFALSAGLVLLAAPLVVQPSATAPAPRYQSRRGTIFPQAPTQNIAPRRTRADQFLGTVLGTVTDDGGHPVAGVAVFVRPFALTLPPVVGAFITDAWGRFRVTGLAAGRYSFVAIHGQHPPGTIEAVPVFPDEMVAAPAPLPCCATRPTPSSRDDAAGVYWHGNGCVEVDIVLDQSNLQDA